jgi:quercetin dioxygenase-like cupin family protein
MVFSNLKDVSVEEILPGIKVRHIYFKTMLVTMIEFAPKAEIPSHRHLHEQVSLVLEGEIEAVVGKEKKKLGVGGIVSVASNVLHSSKATSKGAKVLCSSSPVTKPYKFEPEE